MAKRKHIIVLISLIVLCFVNFDKNLYGQVNSDTSTVISCFTNFGNLELKITEIAAITSDTQFKITTFCPQGNYSLHDSLNIDSVEINLAVTTTNPDAKIGVQLDAGLKEFFNVINVNVNNIIEIETAIIEAGTVRNDSTTLNYSNTVDVIKVIVDVYENDSIFRQDTLGFGF